MQQAADHDGAEKERSSGIIWFLLLRIPELLLAAVLVVLVVFMTISVFSRYALNVGMAWSDEAARLLFIWIAFVGFAIGIRHRGHIAIDWLVVRLPPVWRRASEFLQDLAILCFSLFFLWQSVIIFKFSLMQRMPALRISIGWLYAATVVGGVLMTIYAAANLWENFRRKGARVDAIGDEAMRHAE